MEPPPEKASPKEQFDLLFGLLKDHYTGLIDFQFKHGTVLTLFIGWAIASEQAEKFVRGHCSFAWLGCAVLLFYVGFYSRWVWTFCQRSLLVYTQLCNLNFMPADYFKL